MIHEITRQKILTRKYATNPSGFERDEEHLDRGVIFEGPYHLKKEKGENGIEVGGGE